MGRRLLEARERAGMSREEAAEAADVQPPAIDAWERGRSMPCLVQFRALLAAYGVMPCQIMYARNPFELTRDEVSELSKAAIGFSPGLRARVDLLLALLPQSASHPAEE